MSIIKILFHVIKITYFILYILNLFISPHKLSQFLDLFPIFFFYSYRQKLITYDNFSMSYPKFNINKK